MAKGIQRPTCPVCKTSNPVGNGAKWLCKKCGKQWNKAPKVSRAINDPTRPSCPDCGAPNPKKASSNYWMCQKCGRHYTRFPREVRPLSESGLKRYDDFWQLNWDEFIVGSDAHSPHINERVFNRMLEVAHHYKIKKFIHAGDFFNADLFSKWPIDAEDLVGFDEEIEISKNVIKSLKSVFNEIYFFMGSHDLRFYSALKSLGKEAKFDSPFALLGDSAIHISRYRYAQVGTEWHITHPRNVVRLNSAPALRLMARYQRSVIFGHGHWWGIGRDPSGTHYQIAPGCLVDRQQISYKNLWDTSHEQWTSGFVLILEKNRPVLMAEDSPWDFYLARAA